MVKVLDRKLVRELLGMWGQALAIAAVVAGGTATYVLSTSTLATLKTTQAELYSEYRFAGVFAACKRAPRQVLPRLAEIPGVQAVEARAHATPPRNDPTPADGFSTGSLLCTAAKLGIPFARIDQTQCAPSGYDIAITDLALHMPTSRDLSRVAVFQLPDCRRSTRRMLNPAPLIVIYVHHTGASAMLKIWQLGAKRIRQDRFGRA